MQNPPQDRLADRGQCFCQEPPCKSQSVLRV